MPIITLTTDFGSDSPYVAQMKGVIVSLSPSATIVDITHAIGPQDIFAGALVLGDAAPFFPPETVHVAVVDPGVGTARKLVAVRTSEQWFLAPDNGLLMGVLRTAAPSAIYSIENRALFLPHVSQTFHGRDILSPVAARLALGALGEELGPRVEQLVELDWPLPKISGGAIVGQIVSVDSFGNLITNITERDVRPWCASGNIDVHCAGEVIHGIVQTYGLHESGQLAALFGSSGRLEIAVAGGSTARRLNAARGAAVWLQESPCIEP